MLGVHTPLYFPEWQTARLPCAKYFRQKCSSPEAFSGLGQEQHSGKGKPHESHLQGGFSSRQLPGRPRSQQGISCLQRTATALSGLNILCMGVSFSLSHTYKHTHKRSSSSSPLFVCNVLQGWGICPNLGKIHFLLLI